MKHSFNHITLLLKINISKTLLLFSETTLFEYAKLHRVLLLKQLQLQWKADVTENIFIEKVTLTNFCLLGLVTVTQLRNLLPLH